ncbi:MAG: sulfate/molybdate ABC transporter ATP-binding protein [Oceanipulchritudo sp.]
MSIHASNIIKTFGGTTALAGVDLSVGTGHLVALVGPSGSGKTTLLRIIAGLESPDPASGPLLFHGEEVGRLSARERKVGMVFQHYALFRHMSVADNIAFGLNVRRQAERPSRSAICAKVEELLGLVQLEGFGKRLPHELSGGQRQRVALARALAVEPRILLLDEPFGALDAKVRKDLRRWLRQFHERINLTTVFVTHDQEEALELADEVVVMNKATVEQVGSPQDVFDHPASPFVIEFMGNVNRIRGQGTAARHAGHLYVRPHDIEILPATAPEGLKARVLHIFSAGSAGRLTLRRSATGELIEAEISRAELAQLHPRPGQPVRIRFRHIRVFARTSEGRSQLVERDELLGEFRD